MAPAESKYFRFCARTGRFLGFRPLHGWARMLLPLFGLASLLWVLVRVMEKPSRAAYPCVRAATPVAASFLVYVAGLLSSVALFRQAKRQLATSRIWCGVFSLSLALIFGLTLQTDSGARAGYQSALEDPNQPMGTARGIFPGRVVWIHDEHAVDQSCSNSAGDYWWQDDNTSQSVVDSMVSAAIQTLTGTGSDGQAWDALFRYYNQTHGRGDVGYTAGEKIVIKINLNTGASGTSYVRADYRTVDTSPQIVCAVLDQLVHKAGVAQADIGFGDPGRNVDNIFWNKFHQTFPDVKYWGNGNGRTPIVKSATPRLTTSDGSMQNYLPTCYLEAAYMINIPVFKQHHRAGISLGCKNHFGTFVPFLGNAFPLHYSLPCTNGDRNVDNGGYGKYRIFVDLMGHRDLGGKTILYLVDGLWSSTNWGDPPWKWRMAPFTTQYPASVFASQDPVAIESVGFDFLYHEFYVGNPSGNDFPRYSGVDDFLHQAADSVNWAQGVRYDPENDGSALPRSMGVHEHWNNPTEKKYSRNLQTGQGIELVVGERTTGVHDDLRGERLPTSFSLAQNYPNPFNPATVVSYQLSAAGYVRLVVVDLQGREVAVLVNERKDPGAYSLRFDGSRLSSGVYLLRLTTGDRSSASGSQTRKMVVEK